MSRLLLLLNSVEVVTSASKSCTHTIPDFPLKRSGLAAASFGATSWLVVARTEAHGCRVVRPAMYHYWSAEKRWIEAAPMNYARFGAPIQTIHIPQIQAPATSNLVLRGGKSSVETLNYWGRWTEHANACLPNEGLQDAFSMVVASSNDPYTSYIHLLGGRIWRRPGAPTRRLRLTLQRGLEGDAPHACVPAEPRVSGGQYRPIEWNSRHRCKGRTVIQLLQPSLLLRPQPRALDRTQ